MFHLDKPIYLYNHFRVYYDPKLQTREVKKLKDNIIQIGRSITGHNIYKFNYKGDARRYIGVIAEEVQKIKPEDVVTMPNGFLGVNYNLIDVNFHEVLA